jgi:hypothetical protein
LGELQLWSHIVIRELAMLATLLAFGIGPASFLGRRFDAAARLAIAAPLGFALSTCLFTTLIWFTAARNTYWLIPLIGAISVAVAVRRGPPMKLAGKRLERLWLCPRDALSLALVCAVVAAPLSYTLDYLDTPGPISYAVSDTAGYTEQADGAMTESIREARAPQPRGTNPSQHAWVNYANSAYNIDAAPLAANLNVLLGLHATDTQSLYQIVFLIVAALGAFALVRYVTPRPFWAAPLAGILFAGPFFLQLLADGSQAAICGNGMMLSIAAVGAEALRERRFANLALLALLIAGLMAFYPLYVPLVALACAAALLVVAIRSLWRRRLNRRLLGSAAVSVGAVVALTVTFNVVSAIRDPYYWYETIANSDLNGKPYYDLPIAVLPQWLLQTHELLFLTPFDLTLMRVLAGIALPAILIATIVFGLWRHRVALLLLLLICIFAATAEYASISTTPTCTYCVNRDLVPVVAPTIALIALGVAALATAKRRWLRWMGVVVALATLVAVGNQTRIERQRYQAGAFFLDKGDRTLLAALPAHGGTVHLEGYGQHPERAIVELALVYTLAVERNHGRVSVANSVDDFGAFGALGAVSPNNTDLRPNYRYVLTRYGDVRTARRTIARAGPLALEERTQPIDVTLIGGTLTAQVRLEPQGFPVVMFPMDLLLIGGGSAPEWILLNFESIVSASVPRQPGVRGRATPTGVIVCVPTTGTAPVRRARFLISGGALNGLEAPEEFGDSGPPRGVNLLSMYAVSHCPAGLS